MRSLFYSPRLVMLAWQLVRHGAPAILADLPLTRGRVPRFSWLRPLCRVKGGPGQRLRALLLKLGPSYIKLGQVLSTRVDLLGDEICAELCRLQDQLQGFDGQIAIDCLVRALDKPLDQIFQEFDATPLSAASVAQVHQARDLSGRKVAVKILRPGIEKAFHRDLNILRLLADWLSLFQPRLKADYIIQLYRQQVQFETDLRLEAAAASEFRENFADDERMFLPKVDWSRTSQNVLTLTWVEGTPIDEKDRLLAQGHNLKDLMEKAASLFFKSLLEHGYFHGDQHAGNMMVGPEGQISFVDFGIMGRLSWRQRCFLADILACLLKKDFVGLARTYAAQGYLPSEHDIYPFAQAVRAAAEPLIDQPLDQVSFANLLGQLLQMGASFDLEAQPELYLLQKNMLMAEGISRQLTPKLNIWQLAEPLVTQWIMVNRSPLHKGLAHVERAYQAAGRLPNLVEKLDQRLNEPAQTFSLLSRSGWALVACLFALLWLLNS